MHAAISQEIRARGSNTWRLWLKIRRTIRRRGWISGPAARTLKSGPIGS